MICIVDVLPYYEYCIASLSGSRENFEDDSEIKEGIEASIAKLKHYYDQISPMVGIALILNPTMKQLYFTEFLGWTQEWADQVMVHFKDAFQYYKQRLGISAQSDSQETTSELHGYANYRKRKRELDPSSESQEEEYVRYFNAPLAVDGTDLLHYWKYNQLNFPILSAMAKDYLTIQASSVPAERAFSSGTDLVTADRCRLTGSSIEKTQFLKFHL